MRGAALVLQADRRCATGALEAWALSRRVALDIVRLDRWPVLPAPAGYDLAIAVGARASLAAAWPAWAPAAIGWIRAAADTGIPVFGVCAGAQALAVALGGALTRQAPPHFEWVELEGRGGEGLPSGPWLAAGGETIVVPKGADELATGACGPLAFRCGRHLGLQFHPQRTPELLAHWLADRRGHARERGALLAPARRHRVASLAAALELFDGFAAGALAAA